MIERLIIKNYKSIRELDLLLRPLNVLIGANGAGKSNFVSFFQLAHAVFTGELKAYSLRKGADNLLHHGMQPDAYLEGLIDFDNTNAYVFDLVSAPDESLKVLTEGDYWNGYGNTTKDYSKWHWNAMPLGYLKEQTARAKYVRHYLSSFRVYHFHDTSEDSVMKKSCNLNDNHFLRPDGSNLAAFLYFLQENHPKNFLRISKTVQSIAPFFNGFDLKPLRNRPEFILLEWKERGSDKYFNAHNLSDGTLRFIALATLLLQPDPPKTIIIDEPELGLHPFAIHKLGALLQKATAQSQVILATQSVELVNQFNAEDILVVDREDGQSVFKRLDSEKLVNWLDTFLLGDIWQKNVIGGQP